MNSKTVASTLLQALPYIKKFHNKTIVIKYGGSAQTNDTLKDIFAQDIVLLSLIGIRVVIVHGGGAKISSMLDKFGIQSEFVKGHRVTTKEIMEVVEMVLYGNINSSIVSMLNHHGAKALGITGKDLQSFSAKPKYDDENYTGEITEVKGEVIEQLLREKFIPVITPIANGSSPTHPGFNINADSAASAIAGAIKARKVIFLTDTAGVLDKDKNLISSLTLEEIQTLKDDETITGGMIPKVDACLDAISQGVKQAHIIDGRVEHSILLELLTEEGVGTVIS